MGLFASFFPGITGFNPAYEAPMTGMFMAAPPNIQHSLMTQFGGLRSATGPFETVMHQAFATAPPEVQTWARDYAGAHKMGFMANILGAAPTAAPAAPSAVPVGQRPGFLSTLLRIESGGRNVPNVHQRTSSGQAQGFFQITTGTWNDFGRRAGIDLAKYPTPLSAPYDVQAHVAGPIPLSRWDPITIHALRAGGFNVDLHATLAQNLAANGENFSSAGHTEAHPLLPISSNPDAALVHAAGMASPSDPGPPPGLSSPMVPAAPAPLVMPAAPGAPSGPFAGGSGGPITLTGNPTHEIQPSPPLEAAGAAQQADMKARQMMDFLMPVPADTATSGQPMQNLFGSATTDPKAAEGIFQSVLSKVPSLAKNTGGLRYRA